MININVITLSKITFYNYFFLDMSKKKRNKRLKQNYFVLIKMYYNYKFKDDVHYGNRNQHWGYYNSVEISLNNPNLPHQYSLSKDVTKIYNQDNASVCVSCAISTAISMKIKIKNESKFFSLGSSIPVPSILYNYNLSKLDEGANSGKDSKSVGAECMIETGLKILKDYGFCEESIYESGSSSTSGIPNLSAFVNANYNKGYYKFDYNKLQQNIETIKSSIVSGNPVIMGIVIFESIAQTVNGLIPTPSPDKEKNMGGHVILLIGYNDNKKTFKFVNCSSEDWGDKGYGYIMYDYVINPDIAGDIYNITLS